MRTMGILHGEQESKKGMENEKMRIHTDRNIRMALEWTLILIFNFFMAMKIV